MKIVVVEDHMMFREAIVAACTRHWGHEVAGSTGLGEEAVALVGSHRPELLILDLGLPDLDGFRVAQRARHLVPSLRVLVFTAHLDEYTAYRVEHAGFHGFLDKSNGGLEALRLALEQQAQGKTTFCPAFEAARRARQENHQSFDKLLSAAELNVLSLIAQGLSDVEIGHRHGTTEWTAQAHRSHILRKLRIDGTPKLIAFATRLGFARFEPTPVTVGVAETTRCNRTPFG